MTKLLIKCPTTQEFIDTGLDPKHNPHSDVTKKRGLFNKVKRRKHTRPAWWIEEFGDWTVTCPACGQQHVANVSNVFLQV